MRWKLPQQYEHIGRPSLSLRRRTRLSHRGQRKKLQEPPFGKRLCASRTSRLSSIAPKPIQTLVMSAVILPSALSRETLAETGRLSSNNLCAVITSRYHRTNGQETASRCRARRVGVELENGLRSARKPSGERFLFGCYSNGVGLRAALEPLSFVCYGAIPRASVRYFPTLRSIGLLLASSACTAGPIEGAHGIAVDHDHPHSGTTSSQSRCHAFERRAVGADGTFAP